MKVYLIYLCCFLAFLFNVASLLAGEVYDSDWSTRMWVIASSTLLGGYSLYQHCNLSGLSPQQIESLDAGDINKFDRWTTRNYSPFSDDISYVVMGLCLATPLVYNFDKTLHKDRMEINFIIAETYLLTGSLVQLSKVSFTRNRPLTYNDDVSMKVKQKKDSRYSFISGHTAFAFAGATLFSRIYDDVYPDKKSFWVYAGTITVASSVGLLRINSGKHFPTDVLTGALVGTGSALFVTRLHKKAVSQFTVKGVTMRLSVLGFEMEF